MKKCLRIISVFILSIIFLSQTVIQAESNLPILTLEDAIKSGFVYSNQPHVETVVELSK